MGLRFFGEGTSWQPITRLIPAASTASIVLSSLLISVSSEQTELLRCFEESEEFVAYGLRVLLGHVVTTARHYAGSDVVGYRTQRVDQSLTHAAVCSEDGRGFGAAGCVPGLPG